MAAGTFTNNISARKLEQRSQKTDVRKSSKSFKLRKHNFASTGTNTAKKCGFPYT